MNITQSSTECILLWRSRIIGNFYAGLVLKGIMVNINIGAFIKAVMIWRRSSGWFCEVVVNICKAIPAVRHNPRTALYRYAGKSVRLTQSQGALRPLMVACLTIQSTECKYTTMAASRGERKRGTYDYYLYLGLRGIQPVERQHQPPCKLGA